MRFRFNDQKTTQAAAHLLKLHGGTMDYIKLIKLLYLTDRQMLLDHGIPLTGDTMLSMRHGPVLSRVLDFINNGENHQKSLWFKIIAPPAEYAVSLRPEFQDAPPVDELSEYELQLLREIHEQYGSIDKWKLVDLLHDQLPEWRDPGHSVLPISPADILRAEDRSDEQIADVKRTAEDLWFLGRAG